jgi:hypothetical protein
MTDTTGSSPLFPAYGIGTFPFHMHDPYNLDADASVVSGVTHSSASPFHGGGKFLGQSLWRFSYVLIPILEVQSRCVDCTRERDEYPAICIAFWFT